MAQAGSGMGSMGGQGGESLNVASMIQGRPEMGKLGSKNPPAQQAGGPPAVGGSNSQVVAKGGATNNG